MKAKIIKNNSIIYPELSYTINGILFDTHKELGIFRNEKQYCDYIEYLLKDKNINYEREKVLLPSFDNEMKGRNKVDFLIEDKIVLEIKAKSFVNKNDYYQTKRYLESIGRKLAILVNMRRNAIFPKRILNSNIETEEEHLA